MTTKQKPTLAGAVLAPILICVVIYLEQPAKYSFPVTRVIDGDTIEIEAPFLPVELKQKLSVRVIGIDTPEKGNLAKCDLERKKSSEAKAFVEQTLRNTKDVKVVLKSWDKYGGRVLGDFILDGENLSKKMIDKGFAVEYYGDKKSKDWCK